MKFRKSITTPKTISKNLHILKYRIFQGGISFSSSKRTENNNSTKHICCCVVSENKKKFKKKKQKQLRVKQRRQTRLSNNLLHGLWLVQHVNVQTAEVSYKIHNKTKETKNLINNQNIKKRHENLKRYCKRLPTISPNNATATRNDQQ